MVAAWSCALTLALLGSSCSSVDPAPTVPPCDQACQDGVAMRAVREMTKLMFNLTLQGKPVGPQDQSLPCPEGGLARVYGEATSDAGQGATVVDLTYEFTGCGYLQIDNEAPENYRVKVTGTITQKGTFSAQSSATTAVIMKSDALSVEGTVYDPPSSYQIDRCGLSLTQNGNTVSGTVCERKAGFSF